MSFTYDAVSNRKTRTDYNGALTDYTYDALNRLKTISYPDATTVAYTYDKLSRMQTATNQNGVIDFDYNKINRLVGVADVFGQVIDYSYDPNGNRTKLTLNAATAATYRYDAGDRLTKLIDSAGAATNYTYDVTNKLTSRRLPNGILTTYQFDGLDRLTRLLDAKGVVTVADHQYQYSTANQITQIAEPTNTKSYGYDAVDQLTSASYTSPAQPNENYGYDGVGNRASSHLSATYSHQPFNRLVSTAAATYSYDTNGNLLTKTDSNGTAQYGWDFENRLKQVSLPNGNTVTYKYDPLGRRIERSATLGSPLPLTTTTRFVYDGHDVVRDLNTDGSTSADYLNGPGIDNKIRQTTATGAALYFLQDHLGSTRALTDANGLVVEQMSYDSFGNSSGSPVTRYGYTGRERDPDTGLLYYRARFYDPQVGRFMSEDPIGFLGGDINLYAYVANNPIRFSDPTGTQIRSDRNWNTGDINPITGKRLSNDMLQAAGMACALDGFNPWVSTEAGGAFHLLSPTGGNGAAGMKINLWTMEVCFYVRTCVRSGFGVYAGGGLTGAFNFGPSAGPSSGGWSTNVGGDVAVPGEAGRFTGRGSSGNLGLGRTRTRWGANSWRWFLRRP